ncbi:hok/gef family protein [Escherichia coli 3-020-07_S3_C1]|nr:hok/gef family protein [Escherichia coli 2-460-02_S4_C3]KDZ30489.1 hok/gef family protein [Escherichia coli 3-020-07_S3_C1]KDZ30584.1 hok/gef family protein [Escherichia coli 3-020-07_S3_C1]KDZ32784.1 hok/gef family protein [Escherichia coli 3-020-07_S3_C1]KDZ32977.1 hok/gef family protein [Escherichia coli 3-020-07_S3_C1]
MLHQHSNFPLLILRQLQYLCELTQVYDEIYPYWVARRVRHGVVFFTDIQGTVM